VSSQSTTWSEISEKLPDYLKRLLASDVFGRGGTRVAPPRTHGVYLFTEDAEHLYVGRCGLTERARKLGRGHSNFRTRLAGHSRPSSSHNQATLAWRLTVEALGEQLNGMPTTRAELERNSTFGPEFLRQKERVTAMDFRIVEIEDDLESYVFEAYAASCLVTPYNSWATS
jgi:hypothetical protein